jgi:lipoprotein-anchoring transpeptidase ErfK/SrfK
MATARLLILAAAALALGLAPAAGSGAPSPPPKPPNGTQATTARVLAAVTARGAPRLTARRIAVVQPFAPLAGGSTVLLVRGATRVNGRLWLKVLLPVRPNGTMGWIPANVARLQRNRLRVIIRVQSRRLDLYRSGRRILRAPIAVGQAVTPTPVGRFAIAERIPTNDAAGFLGPFVMPITGYSRVLNEYAGGNGRVAIHGTSQPWVIGTQASHGCIRLYNADITRLARIVTPGTQVEIRPR